MIRLVINRFDGREEIFNPLQDETLIGRNDPASGIVNHIDLPDSTLSRHHAKISFENGAFFIEDLSSINGTWVNEKHVLKIKLVPGDRITIGRNTLLFETEGTRTINPLDFMVSENKVDHKKTINSNYYILQQLSKLLVTKH